MKVEKNILMDSEAYGRTYDLLTKMEIGDSIFDKGAKSTSCKESKLYASAQQAGIRNGMKFSGRKVDGGVRIWRVS